MSKRISTNKSKMALRNRHIVPEPFCRSDCDAASDTDSENDPHHRELMRPWLLRQILKGGISGLQWTNREKMMVKIPWTHGSRQGFDVQKDACLFKRWAQHTGKYVEGQQYNPKRWKANFRCAMNSLNDVEEVKDMSKSRGHNAYKIYQFLSEKTRIKKQQKKKDSTQPTQADYYKNYATNADRQEMLRKIKEKVQKQQKLRTMSAVSMHGSLPSETSDYCSASDEADSSDSDSNTSQAMSVTSGVSTTDMHQSSYGEHSYASSESPVPSPLAYIPSSVEELCESFPTSQPNTNSNAQTHAVHTPELHYTTSCSTNTNQMTSPIYCSPIGYADPGYDTFSQSLTEDDLRNLMANSSCETSGTWDNSDVTPSMNSTINFSSLLNSSDQSSNFNSVDYASPFIMTNGLNDNLIADNSKVAVAHSKSTYALTYTAQYELGFNDM